MTASLVFTIVSEADLLKNYTCKLETVSSPGKFVTIRLEKNGMFIIQCLVTQSTDGSQNHLALKFTHRLFSSFLSFPGCQHRLRCVLHDFCRNCLREVQNLHDFVPAGHPRLSPQLLRYLLNSPCCTCT